MSSSLSGEKKEDDLLSIVVLNQVVVFRLWNFDPLNPRSASNWVFILLIAYLRSTDRKSAIAYDGL